MAPHEITLDEAVAAYATANETTPGRALMHFAAQGHLTLDEALSMLASKPPRRPYEARIESAAPAIIGAVVALYGLELHSTSEAVRDLLARGAASLAAERA